MAATTLQRWTSATDGVAAAVGAVLTRSTAPRGADAHPIAPARGPAPSPRLAATLAATGSSVVRAAVCAPYTDDEKQAILPLLAGAGRASLTHATWADGWYQRDFSPIYTQLKAVRRLQRDRAGRLNVASLLHSPLLGCDLLLHESGRPLRQSDLKGLAASAVKVKDLLELQWVNHRTLRFRLRGEVFPYPAAREFRILCDTLVCCYPELLLPQNPELYLRERIDSTDLWCLERRGAHLHLLRDSLAAGTEDLGTVTTLRHAERIARRSSKRQRLQFAPHSVLSTVLPLWGSATRLSRARLKLLISEPRRSRAEKELDARSVKAHADSPDIAAALEGVDWIDVHRLEHSSSRQRLAFHTVKGQRVSGWDWVRQRRGCPHCPDAGPDGGSTFHAVWTCPAAQSLWDQVHCRWRRLGLRRERTTAATDQYLSAIFGLELPRTPPKAWELTSLHQGQPKSDDPAADPFPLLQAMLQQIVLGTMVHILAWRTVRTPDDRPLARQQALVLHDAHCHRVIETLATRLAANAASPKCAAVYVREVWGVFRHSLDLPVPAPHDLRHVRHLLFFDGGSRGNPGPGGSGAVLIQITPATGSATILWSAAMSHASKHTTNNQAEYRGLLTGLQRAAALQLRALEVAGDSAFILGQLRQYSAPKNRALQALYSQTRRLADRLDVQHWHHHRQAYNQMADSLANLAMDARASSQVSHPTQRGGHQDLPALLHNDLRPWLSTTVSQPVEL